jgi:hypothetical protein
LAAGEKKRRQLLSALIPSYEGDHVMGNRHTDDEHVPMFPAYVRTLPNRVLAYYDQTTQEIITEAEERFSLPGELPGLVDLFNEQNLLVFVGDMLSFPLLPECVASSAVCEVFHAPPSGNRPLQPISLRIKGKGNKRYWIVQSDVWGFPPCMELLQALRDTYNLCEVGAPTTPGGLGQALMRRSWLDQFGEEWKKHRHSRPTMFCVRDLHQHGTGGRVDTPGMGQQFDMLLERDLKNAYASCYIRQPTGTAVRLWRDPGARDGCVTYFNRVSITVSDLLPLGPFPLRRVDKYGKSEPIYPREPGRYDTWLWKEEIDDCIRAGCSVDIFEGWGWTEWTYDNASWVDLMERLRDSAPSSTVAGIIKLATVAGIGRHGMGEYHYTLVGERKSEQDIQVCDQVSGESLDWFVHATRDVHFSNMTHWYAYTMMLCRHVLYNNMLGYAEQERLVASNYDAFYISGPFTLEELAMIERGEPVRTGQWKTELLHSKPGKPPVPYPRAIDTKEKVRLPGVQRE